MATTVRARAAMPEGQVSHRNARRLGAALAGARVVRVEAADRIAAQRIPERLAGDRFTAVEALGKHHLLRFASGRVLHSHLGMNGRWRIAPTGTAVPLGGLWIAIHTDDHVVTQHHGPRLRLYEPGDPIPGVSRLGPDLLDADTDPAEAACSAIARAEPGRAIGDALLDQRLLAGLGNVYRAETLFLCAVDPWRTCSSITADEARSIGRTGSRLLREGVDHPGPITTYRGPDPRSHERTWVYGRRGRPCRRCGTPVRAAGMGEANRTLYWCPGCQR